MKRNKQITSTFFFSKLNHDSSKRLSDEKSEHFTCPSTLLFFNTNRLNLLSGGGKINIFLLKTQS
jgi:hypothetical protein